MEELLCVVLCYADTVVAATGQECMKQESHGCTIRHTWGIEVSVVAFSGIARRFDEMKAYVPACNARMRIEGQHDIRLCRRLPSQCI